MKRTTVIIIALAGLSLAVTATASTSALWTTQKAERTVVRSTLLQLPSTDRAALEQELSYSVTLFTALGLAAEEMGNAQAVTVYAKLALRYTTALRKVRGGLAIERAQCVGVGRAHVGRFAGFRCMITSEPLSIPSIALLPAPADELPAVLEDTPKVVGPFHAKLAVRVTGRSTMTSQQLVARAAPPTRAVWID